MSTEPGEPTLPLGARLSPFVFASDTTFRFLLLLVAVFGANLYIWNWLWLAVGIDQREQAEAYFACTLGNEAAISSASTVEARSAASDALSACLQDANSSLAYWMVGGTLLLVVVASTFLLLTPSVIKWRRRFRALERRDAPAVLDELETLVRESGLEKQPEWVWSPLDPSPTGLAFGRPGKHTVALMGGLVTRHFSDLSAFRAVVRHELAHLRNRDVDITYATVSLWYAFLLVSVLPFAIVVADEGLRTILSLSWRMLALALLVYLTRNAVLRAREVYADVRASVPDGQRGALRRILGGLPEKPSSVWRRLWRVHPAPSARLASVNDPSRLFPLGLLVAFGVGVGSTIALESLVTLLGIYVHDPVVVHMLAAAVFAPLAMGALGVGIWRSDWGALAESRRPPPTWPLALAFAAGLLVGPELALERIVRLEGQSTLIESAFGSGAPWIVALGIGVVLLLGWVNDSARVWIRSLAGTARPTLATIAGLAIGSGMLAIFVGVFFALRATREAISVSRMWAAQDYDAVSREIWVGPLWLWQLIQDGQTQVVLTQPVVFVALFVLWAFPLGAWIARKAQLGDAPWAFLEPGGRLRIPPLGKPSLDPWLVGLVAGGLCLVAFLALRVALRNSVDADTRGDTWFLFGFFYWQIVLALTAQAGASVVVVARGRTSAVPLVGALAAAFTTGLIATSGIMLSPSLAGCVDPIAMNPGPCAWQVDAGFSWFVLRQVVAEGALLAIASGLVVLALKAVLHRRHAPVPAAAG